MGRFACIKKIKFETFQDKISRISYYDAKVLIIIVAVLKNLIFNQLNLNEFVVSGALFFYPITYLTNDKTWPLDPLDRILVRAE